jgi:hypothetical protein
MRLPIFSLASLALTLVVITESVTYVMGCELSTPVSSAKAATGASKVPTTKQVVASLMFMLCPLWSNVSETGIARDAGNCLEGSIRAHKAHSGQCGTALQRPAQVRRIASRSFLDSVDFVADDTPDGCATDGSYPVPTSRHNHPGRAALLRPIH